MALAQLVGGQDQQVQGDRGQQGEGEGRGRRTGPTLPHQPQRPRPCRRGRQAAEPPQGSAP
ncbi:MAG: hypothetical protein ACK559_10535, partial [bacterium]